MRKRKGSSREGSSRAKKKARHLLDSLFERKRVEDRSNRIDPRLLKMALEYTGTATEQGKLVFKDVVSGGLYIFPYGIPSPLPPGTKRIDWPLPWSN